MIGNIREQENIPQNQKYQLQNKKLTEIIEEKFK